MAGYIMNLNNYAALTHCFETGTYSTKIPLPKSYSKNTDTPYPCYWLAPQEGTLADYSTMNPGDNIYFFIDRKIYGIGIFKSIDSRCSFNNFPNSSAPINIDCDEIRKTCLVDYQSDTPHHRWICIFEPSPYFFKKGIDMDDILSSNPSKFKMLRAFWKLSFIKIDEEENKALKDVLLKNNQDILAMPDPAECFLFNPTTHNKILSKLTNNLYNLSVREVLKACASNTILNHEMALEAGTLYQLNNNVSNSISIFGAWDYLSHQVIASPFKPIDYMDKMDIFGYRYIPNFPGTISKYLVIELKRGSASSDDINQLLKYIDWINQEYTFGDYSMIEAFLVASSIPPSVIQARNTLALRNYIIGRRPPKSSVWTNLKLVEYTFNSITNEIDYTLI